MHTTKEEITDRILQSRRESNVKCIQSKAVANRKLWCLKESGDRSGVFWKCVPDIWYPGQFSFSVYFSMKKRQIIHSCLFAVLQVQSE